MTNTTKVNLNLTKEQQSAHPRAGNRQMVDLGMCELAVTAAEFVAIDFELSGLYDSLTPMPAAVDMDLEKIIKGVESFSAVQIGIACARRCGDVNDWRFQSFTFNLTPTRATPLKFDLSSMKFLVTNGFDLNEWVNSAICMGDDSQSGRALMKIIEKARRRPLVLHNGLFDTLHLLKLIDPSIIHRVTPANLKDVLRHEFRAGIYDTKTLAHPILNALRIPYNSKSTSLKILHDTLQQATSRFNLCGTAAAGNAGDHLHEAGYDALLTGITFIRQLYYLSEQQSTVRCGPIAVFLAWPQLDNVQRLNYTLGTYQRPLRAQSR